jgi:NADH-quinone oxidoreductase subunit K
MNITLLIYISMVLFLIGLLGVLAKRNILIAFLSIELMLNSANLLFVGFAWKWGNETGLLWVFFVLLVAAAEAAVGLALIIHQFRIRQRVDMDQYNLLKG